MNNMIGTRIQNYEIKSHLGEGGMGTVFRASDSILNRDVALKMLHTPLLQQPTFLERFKKEARVLAQLLHPNIAVIYNMIEQDNNHFMVMEFVEGKNLDSLLRQYQTLSYKVVVPVIVQALEGLGHAHKKGIYHRDIKPSNLILKSDGTVKLMDFGIAMVAGEQRLTQVNRVVGTVEYISPEIIQGKEPSTSTDLYAMGVTMYELLTGKLPFAGDSDYNLMQDILKKKPLSVDKMNPSVPRVMSDIVMKTLEKKPGDRFTSARDLQQALINAFPELKNVELNDDYIRSAAQLGSPGAAYTHKRTPPSAQTVPGGVASNPLAVFGRFREKAFAKENRIITICVAGVLLTAICAFIFMPHGGNNSNNNSGTNSDQTQKSTVVPLNKSGDSDEKNPTEPVTTQNKVVPIPMPEPVEEKPTKKKPVQKEQKKSEEKEKNEKDKNQGGNGEQGTKHEPTDQGGNGDEGTKHEDKNNDDKKNNNDDKKSTHFEKFVKKLLKKN